MGGCEAIVVCMKHPNHKQQPGVCSCCLRERLSKFSGPSMAVSSSSSSDYYDLYSPSNVSYSDTESSSPTMSSSHRGGRGRHHRIGSDVLVSFSFISSKSGNGLKKSRSIAYVTGRVTDGLKGKTTKKGGFWAKLLKSTSKRTK